MALRPAQIILESIVSDDLVLALVIVYSNIITDRYCNRFNCVKFSIFRFATETNIGIFYRMLIVDMLGARCALAAFL